MQIQGAINETINRQVLPEIKAALRYINAQPPQMGWNLPGERPERKSENDLTAISEVVLEMNSS